MNVKLAKWLSLSGSLLAAACVLEAEIATRQSAGQFSETRGKVASRIEALNKSLMSSSKDASLPRPRRTFQSQQQIPQTVKTVSESTAALNAKDTPGGLSVVNPQLKQTDAEDTEIQTPQMLPSKSFDTIQQPQVRNEPRMLPKSSAQFETKNIGEDPDEIDRQLQQVDSALRMVYAKQDTLHRDLSKVRNGAQKKQIRQELKKLQTGAEQLAAKRRRLQEQKENLSRMISTDVAFRDVPVPYVTQDTIDAQDALFVNDMPAQMHGVPLPPPPPPPPPPNWNPTVKASMSGDIPLVPTLEPQSVSNRRRNSMPPMGTASHIDMIKNGNFALRKVFTPTPLQIEYWEYNKPCWKEIRSTCLPGIRFADEDSFLAAVRARRGGFVETHQLRAQVPFADLDGKTGTKFTFVKGSKISAEAFVYTNRSVKVEFYDGSVAYIASDGKTLTGFDLPEGVEEVLPTNVVPQSKSSNASLLKEDAKVNLNSAPKPPMVRSNSLGVASAPVSNENFLDLIRKGVALRKVDRSGDDAKKQQPNATKNMSEAEMLASANIDRAPDDSDLAEYCNGFDALKKGLIKADRLKYRESINVLDQLIGLTYTADNAPEDSLNAFKGIQSELKKFAQTLQNQSEQLKNISGIQGAFEKVFGKNAKGGCLEDFQDYINGVVDEIEEDTW